MTNILVVEDEGIVAKSIQNRLEMLGYQVPAIVSSGEEVLSAAETLQPDLVLMDIRLQGRIDGIQVAQQLRARHKLPIVFLSAYCDDATIERAKQAHPYGFIVKPFAHADLRATIELALYKHKFEQENHLWSNVIDSLLKSNDAVIMVNPEGNILSLNYPAQNLIGQMEGQRAEDAMRFIKRDTLEPAEYPLRQAAQSKQKIRCDGNLILVNVKKEEWHVTVFTLLMYNDRNELMTGVYILQDFSRCKRS